MPINPRLLRKLFAGGALLTVLIASAFYLRGLLARRNSSVGEIKKMPSNVVKSTKGFTFSKSEGGRTLFTIQASQAEEFKEGGRAELHDVNIVIYGRNSSRFDQIYGSDFQYDPRTGDVTANGEVHIDLESNANGASRPDQTPPQETKNPIHLKTSGLTFNQKTGFAQTKERIEFRIPEATGSAVGATYDSHANLLTLQSAVRVVTTGNHKATITAQRATFTKEPQRAVLESARMEQLLRSVQADKVTVMLRDDNTIDRVLASGNIHVQDTGPKAFKLNAPQAEVLMADKEQVRSGTLFGGVVFESGGDSPAHGTAGRLLLDFGPKSQVTKARAQDSVQMTQGTPEKSMQLQAAAVDAFIGNKRKLERAVTSGAAQVVVMQGPAKDTITAGEFQAKFGAKNRFSSITGSSNAKIVSSTPGKPDVVMTSRDLTAGFDDLGKINVADLTGDFRYQEGTRTASADHARYLPADEAATLTGSPRVMDSGTTLTANNVQINRKTGAASAQGDVKATYTSLKSQPDGGMLASADPIHVTGTSMTANRNTEMAKFTNARLWQSENIVEAPVITFDRGHRSLQAQSSGQGRVSCVFVDPGKSGKPMPVNVTADKLSYVDGDRKAVFSGNVIIRGAETTMIAQTVQVLLAARGNQAGTRLERIVAQGEIEIQQPGRKATGNQAVYTAQDEKFVLTASNGARPTIFDAQRGQISGDSLTFYTHDDRVLVDSKESSKTLIQTRIRDASKK